MNEINRFREKKKYSINSFKRTKITISSKLDRNSGVVGSLLLEMKKKSILLTRIMTQKEINRNSCREFYRDKSENICSVHWQKSDLYRLYLFLKVIV